LDFCSIRIAAGEVESASGNRLVPEHPFTLSGVENMELIEKFLGNPDFIGVT
jgi:hypothetical protein